MVGYRRVKRAALLNIFLLKVLIGLERKFLLLDKCLEGRILLVSGLTEGLSEEVFLDIVGQFLLYGDIAVGLIDSVG